MLLSSKATIRWILPIITSLLLVTSCTIQKRLYNKGYSVEWKKKPGSVNKDENALTLQSNESVLLTADNTSVKENPGEPVNLQITSTEANGPNPIPVTNFNDDTTSTENRVESHEILHSGPVILKKQPKQANPPDEDLREIGIETLKEAVKPALVTLLFLFITLVSLYISSVISITILQTFLTILALLSIVCLSGFFGYVFASIVIALYFLIAYRISKRIYEKRNIQADESIPASG